MNHHFQVLIFSYKTQKEVEIYLQIVERLLLAHQRAVDLLVDVAVALDDEVPLQDARGFGSVHASCR